MYFLNFIFFFYVKVINRVFHALYKYYTINLALFHLILPLRDNIYFFVSNDLGFEIESATFLKHNLNMVPRDIV